MNRSHKIEDDSQLEHTIQAVAKMYAIRDRDAADPGYDPGTRDDIVESTVSMIRHLEWQIADYLCAHPERYAPPPARECGPAA